jgi:voltage-gated potassium channel
MLALTHLKDIFKRLSQLFFAISLLLLSFVVGIIGYMQIEDMTFSQSFFMSVIIISTLGMNEIKPLSEAGKLFTSFFVIYNLTTFTFFASVLTKYIFEGELRAILRHYISKTHTYSMKNHIIVCGYGRYGRRVCTELAYSHIPFFVIENNNEKISSLTTDLDPQRMALVGNATEDDTLIEAGIKKAKAIICALPEDADNVFVTLTARELNPAIKIVAKATHETTVGRLYRAGANEVVLPDVIGGLQMANLVIRPEIVEFVSMMTGTANKVAKQLHLEELHYENFLPHQKGKNIAELDIKNQTGVVLIGYKDKQKGFVLNPTEETVFKDGDILIVLGTYEQIGSFFGLCKQG